MPTDFNGVERTLAGLSREQLAFVAATAIDLMDDIDGDPDLEITLEDDEDDTEDCCVAGDDRVCSGAAVPFSTLMPEGLIGSDDDAEESYLDRKRIARAPRSNFYLETERRRIGRLLRRARAT